MIRPWLGLLLTCVLCGLSLPFIAISMLIAAVCTVPIATVSHIRRRKRDLDAEIRRRWQSNEFAFERAIEAYEELIDAHAWRR